MKQQKARGRRLSLDLGITAVLAIALVGLCSFYVWQEPGSASEADVLTRPASADAWAALAEKYAATGRTDQAVRAMHRAVTLAPNIPAISMRAVNLHLGIGDEKAVLSASANVFRTTTEYNSILFTYFDQMEIDVADVLQRLDENSQAQRAYFEFLCSRTGFHPRVPQAWDQLRQRRALDDRSAAAYTRYLLGNEKPAEAVDAWASFKQSADPSYPVANHVFNGGWELAPTASPLDWQISPYPGVETSLDGTVARSGRQSLALTFSGDANIEYRHVRQLAWLGVGKYNFGAWIRAENITTDQGLYLQVGHCRTSAVLGTTDGWQRVEGTLSLPKTAVCEVRVCRDRSRKFDSKVSGKIWIDDVQITPAQRP